jgi:hypothetical protein
MNINQTTLGRNIHSNVSPSDEPDLIFTTHLLRLSQLKYQHGKSGYYILFNKLKAEFHYIFPDEFH